MSQVSLQIRYMFLILRESDLNNKITQISQIKQNLASNTSDLLNAGVNLDPNSPEMKVLEARRQRLVAIEKRLDVELAQYQTQLKAVETEIQGVRNNLGKAIERDYSFGFGGGH